MYCLCVYEDSGFIFIFLLFHPISSSDLNLLFLYYFVNYKTLERPTNSHRRILKNFRRHIFWRNNDEIHVFHPIITRCVYVHLRLSLSNKDHIQEKKKLHDLWRFKFQLNTGGSMSDVKDWRESLSISIYDVRLSTFLQQRRLNVS